MARKVNGTPALPRPDGLANLRSLSQFDQVLVRALFDELTSHAQRLNLSITADGAESFTHPLILASYTVSALPAAASWLGGIVRVTDPSGGGQVIAYSDGTDWRRTDNGNIVT